MLTSRSTDSQAVKFWDTYRPDQYRSEPWVHLARGDVLPCVLLWTLDSGYRLLPAGLSVIKSLLSTCRTEESSWRQNEFAAVCSARCVFVFQPPSCLPSLHTDCLGLRFTWLHSLLDNFPSLVNFALKLRCATGLCPRDLEDYGCSCRYVAVGDPVDPLDL